MRKLYRHWDATQANMHYQRIVAEIAFLNYVDVNEDQAKEVKIVKNGLLEKFNYVLNEDRSHRSKSFSKHNSFHIKYLAASL